MEEHWANIQAFVSANFISWITAALILVIGYIVASILRWGIAASINRTGLGAKAKDGGSNLGRSVGTAVFWIILLYALYQALTQLDMGETLAPLERLLISIGLFVPKLLGAVLFFFIGAVVARVAQRATETSLEAIQIDKLTKKIGLGAITGGTSAIPHAAGLLVFIAIIIPVSIGALGALQIEEISQPLTNMLNSFLDFIPELAAATVVLAIAVLIGNWASNALQNILPSLGFDNALRQVSAIDDGEPFRTPPSKIAGTIVFIVASIVGLTAAVDILNIETLDDILTSVIEIGGYLVLAAIILVIGLFVSNFLRRMVAGMGNEVIATVFYVASISLFGFMALSQLDFGESDGIVQTAFEAIVYAAAVAAGIGGAIAFGLGGREWAASKLQKWWPSAKPAPARKAPAKKTTTRRKTTKK